jgi:NAD(P)-dependent dehydrogenase (short-subunit alcohol dehydrogenase family)
MPNAIDLKGRVAVITGGAQGIGRAIAERFLRSGAVVWLWDHDVAAVAKAVDELGPLGPVFAEIMDVVDPAAVAAAAKRTAESGRIDILVNNAGIAGANLSTWEYPAEEWARVIAINLTGRFY